MAALRGRGHTTSASILGFLTPSAPCQYQIQAASLRLVRILLTTPLTSHRRRHMYVPQDVRPTSVGRGRDLPLEIKRRQSLRRAFFAVVLILGRREEEQQHEPQEQFHADRCQMENQSVVPSATGGDFQQKYIIMTASLNHFWPSKQAC